jgi:DNA-binding response OmpR family regulator
MATILVVDDEPDVRQVIRQALERDGHDVVESSDATGADAALRNGTVVDLVLLDIGMPDRSGLDLLTESGRPDVPIIVVSGRSAEPDRVVGLRLGADDYIVKPFSVHELAARVAAVLRRAASRSAPPMVFGDLTILPIEREVSVGGSSVELTAREFALLLHLAAHARQVFSRDDLLRDIWHSKAAWQDPATVTEHVRRLRHKVGAGRIETVRGAGYRFVPGD